MSQSSKTCSKCGKEKPLLAFYTARRGALGRAAACKSCSSLQARTWRYGITADQWADLQVVQQGCCAICERPLGDGYYTTLDHCHSTGRVRGLLCQNCNAGLGKFLDSPDILIRAAEYLLAHADGDEPEF